MSADSELAALKDELAREQAARIKLQAALMQREQSFHAVAELAKLSIWECDLRELMSELRSRVDAVERLDRDVRYVQEIAGLIRIKVVNAETLRIFGSPTKDLLNECLRELVRDDAVALFRGLFKALHAGERLAQAEGKMYRLDGGELHVATGVVLTEQEGSGAMVIVADLSSHHRRLEAEQAAEKRGQELDRINNEVERLFHAVSHDLRAPLRAVQSLADFANEDMGLGNYEDVKEHLGALKGRIERLDRMLSDLLSYARVGRVEHPYESVDVGELLTELRNMLALPRGFKLEWGDSMPRIVTQRTLLSQVFLNLIGNSIKHHDKPDGTVRIEAEHQDSFVEFRVIDDGPGIPEQYREKVFGLFTTLKRRDEVEASGMGLAFVQKVIRHLGGRVQVVGPEGRSATFSFTWPRGPLAKKKAGRHWPTFVGLRAPITSRPPGDPAGEPGSEPPPKSPEMKPVTKKE